MKYLTILYSVILTLSMSCDQVPAQQISYGDHRVSQALRVQYPNQNDSTKNFDIVNSDGLEIDMSVRHAVMNSKTGQPFWFLSLPIDWKMITIGFSDKLLITGSHGLIISAEPPQNFLYSNKKELNDSYLAMKYQVKKPVSVDSVFSEILVPQGKRIGMTLLEHYPLPGITVNNTAFTRQFLESSQKDIYKTEGSDWTDRAGNKVFIILYYSESLSYNTFSWSYYLETLKADSSYFEQAKKQWIYAVSNKRFNKSYIEAYNDSILDRKVANAWYRSYYDDFRRDSTGKMVRYNEGWEEDYYRILKQKEKHCGKDRTPEEIRNDLVNVNLIINPFDGKDYLVASGYETYWINQKSQYIQSDDTLFDPNTYETQAKTWKPAILKVSKRNDTDLTEPGYYGDRTDDKDRYIESDDPNFDPNQDSIYEGVWEDEPKRERK